LHLIEHHLVRKVTREEWYTITEKGEKVLQLMKELQHYNTKILRVIGLTGTGYILEYVHIHEKTQHVELLKTIAPHTLNTRLRELLHLELIEHHIKRSKKRKEWYTITGNGERVLQLMRKLQRISINS
jgi:predicted transcriptional regulator